MGTCFFFRQKEQQVPRRQYRLGMTMCFKFPNYSMPQLENLFPAPLPYRFDLWLRNMEVH